MDLIDPWTDTVIERGVTRRSALRRYALAVGLLWAAVALAAGLWWLLA